MLALSTWQDCLDLQGHSKIYWEVDHTHISWKSLQPEMQQHSKASCCIIIPAVNMFASIRSSSRPLELKVRHPEGTGTFSRNDVKTLDLLDSRNESSRCVLRAGILVFAAFLIWSWWSITVWLETTDLNVAQIFWRVVFFRCWSHDSPLYGSSNGCQAANTCSCQSWQWQF